MVPNSVVFKLNQASEATGGLVKVAHPGVSNSVVLGWDLRRGISTKFPCDAGPGAEPPVESHCLKSFHHRTQSQTHTPF